MKLFPKSRKLAYDTRQQLSQVQNNILPVSDVGVKVLHDPEDQVAAGEDCQDDEPEPQKDVDLLIEDVDGQDAEGVVAFYVPWWAKLVEGAFGHPREDVHHGVDAVLLIAVGEGEHLDAKCYEGAIEKSIEEEGLA